MRQAGFLSPVVLAAVLTGGCSAMQEAQAPGMDPSDYGAELAGAALATPAQPEALFAGASPQAPGDNTGVGPSTPARVDGASAARGAKEVSDDKLTGDHMLIFNGTIAMEVDAGEVAPTIDKIVEAAAKLGGYVSKQDDRSVTVRVPSASFRTALRAINEVGEVTHRAVQAEDVSEEYNDIGVRLLSLRATRARLENFLERAKTIEEVLRVETELTRLNGEIDRLEGRMRFLSERASLSTITVSLSERAVSEKVVVKEKVKAPPAKPQTRALPIEWLSRVGIDQLLNLR
jgi:hypothetical protein